MRFFDRFREAAARYGEGVHVLAPPASPEDLARAETQLGLALPAEYRDFLASWDGVDLFHDDLALFSIGAVLAHTLEARSEQGWPASLLWIGASGGGDRVALDAESGGVLEEEEGSGMLWKTATGLERFLGRVMGIGRTLYDREGEFRPGIFTRDGELAPAVALSCARLAIKNDPAAPKAHYELGRALLALAKPGEAERAFEAALELDPSAGWIAFDLGKLRFERGHFEAAAAAFDAAGEAEPGYEHAPFFFAWAARAAQAGGDRAAALRAAERVKKLDPQFGARQVEAAAHELEEDRAHEAHELIELALAIAPGDLRALELRARARDRAR